jgi:hypothetical protein
MAGITYKTTALCINLNKQTSMNVMEYVYKTTANSPGVVRLQISFEDILDFYDQI